MNVITRSIGLSLVVALMMPICSVAKSLDESDKRNPKSKKEDVGAIGDRDVDGGINFYSLEKEVALGKSLAQQLERHAKFVADPVVAEYVNRIGQNLVRNSDAKVPFTIKLIDSQEVNAFALPGGFFFVNSGLLLRTESESELAGVMAHEIAHVAARHGTRQATRGQIANFATIPLLFFGGWGGFGARQAASFAIPVTFLKFSRGMEEEADFLGLQYLYKAGYDPISFVDFFEKMQADEKRKPGTMSKLFSSHPPHGSRIQKTQKHIARILPRKPEYVVSTSEFLQIKARLEQQIRRRKERTEDPRRPRLSRAGSGSTVPTEDAEAGAGEEEERPTLKRR